MSQATSGTREDLTCTVCGGHQWTTCFAARDALFAAQQQFEVRRCEGCGARATWPIPPLDDFALYYPADYEPHRSRGPAVRAEGQSASSRGGQGLPSRFRRMARVLAGTRTYWIPPLPRRARVLEVGCGSGEFLRRLASRGMDCVGIEPAAEAARHAAEISGAEVICGTLDSTDLAVGSFDGVFALHVLEHLAEPRAALARIAAVLKPAGFLVLSVPNAGSWQMAAFKSCWIGCDVPRHLWHFERGHLVRLITSTGFAVERLLAQRHSTLDLFASLGLVMRTRGLAPGLATRLISLRGSPPALLRVLTLPLEWAHEVAGHATRVLVVARREG